jgi:protease I
MKPPLAGRKFAILATEGFEQAEYESPRRALDRAGAATVLVSPRPGKIRAWDDCDFGDDFCVDVRLDDANPDDFDALVLPGGVMNPDQLRMNPTAVDFVRSFFVRGKPVAAICHAPQLLIEADVVAGRRLTSYPSLRRDLINAGAEWVDEPVVVDHGLVTSRRPRDLPQFNARMIEEFADAAQAAASDEFQHDPAPVVGAGVMPSPRHR